MISKPRFILLRNPGLLLRIQFFLLSLHVLGAQLLDLTTQRPLRNDRIGKTAQQHNYYCDRDVLWQMTATN